MALETGTYISDLVATNPVASDAKSQGDDHIRLIKSTVKATFPNVSGAVTPTHTELNYVDGVTSAIQTQIDGKQASDAFLTSIAALGTAANKMLYTTAADTAAETAITAAGRALLDDATAVDQRTTLGAAASGSNADITALTAIADGSASAPSIAHTGDANTGVWFPAADTIAASTGGAERMRIDSSGNVTVTSAALLGYGTGAGGTVTQATSKSTAVTLNKPCGQITMNNAALGGGAVVLFGFTNSVLTATDTMIIHRQSAGSASSYNVWVDSAGTGGCNICVQNISGGSLSEALILNFAIIKSVTS